jgi:hypothetical protein
MTRALRLLALLSLAVVTTTQTRAGEGGLSSEDLRRRFEVEAPAKWAEWLAQLRSKVYQVDSDLTSKTASTPALAPAQVVEWKEDGHQPSSFCRSNANYLATRTALNPGKPRLDFAWGQNDRYYFVVKRVAQGSWTVNDLGAPNEKLSNVEQKFPTEPRTQYPALVVEGKWLTEVAKDPSFRIKSIETVDQGKRVKIGFQSNIEPDPWNKILMGTLWLVPEQYWLMDEYEVHIASRTRGTAHQRVSLGRYEGIPVAEQTTLDYKFEGDPAIHQETRFDWKPGPFVADVFTLSHFDLPEPGFQTEPSGWNLLVWFNVIGLALIATAIAVRRLGKPRK